MVIEEALGSGSHPAPLAETVDGVLQGCSPEVVCAYHLGYLVTKRYRDLKALKGKAYALDVYFKAVRNITGTITPDTLLGQVAKEIIQKEGIALRPDVVSSDDQLPDDDWSVPVTPAPWWFNNPSLFVCRMAIGSYTVTCVRREDDSEQPHR